MLKKQPLKPNPQKAATAIPANNTGGGLFQHLIVFGVPVLVYLQTLSFGFTHFDDDVMITKNIAFLSNIGNILKAFITDQFLMGDTSFYRPLGTVSYLCDVLISGGNHPWMYHLTNVLLLGFIGIALFHLLKRFAFSPRVALLGSLIFCAHPLFVSTIAHIPNRAELLLILFTTLSLIFLSDYLQQKKFLFLLLHWICFCIALFCKETAAFLPFIFVLFYVAKMKKTSFSIKHLSLILLYAIAGVGWYWLRSIAIGNNTVSTSEFGFTPLLLNLRIIPEALAKFFLPSDLAPIPGFSLFNTIAGCVMLLLLLLITFINKQQSLKMRIFCLSWFLLLLIPSMLFKHPNFDYLDHRFFLPLIGILIFVLTSIPDKWIKTTNRSYRWIPIVILFGISSFSFIKSRAYADPMTFYNTAIKQNPNCSLAYHNRAILFEQQGAYNKALSDYSNAIKADPQYSKAYFNRADLYFRQGNPNQAIADYTQAIETKPDYIEAYINRGNLYGKQGALDKAITDFTKVISIKPEYAMAYNNRGGIFWEQGHLDQAIADYSSAIAMDPKYAEAYENRGMIYGNKENYDQAISDFSKAIELSPDNPENYFNRGIVYNAKGESNKACQDFEKARQLGSASAEEALGRLCK